MKTRKQRKNRILVTLLKNILLALLLIIVLYNLVYFISSVFNLKPNLFGINLYITSSRSMEPEINKNDIVILKKVKEKNLSEEDIILFLRNEEDYRMARIRNTRENKGIYSYVVKADNNYYVEEILGETIQGKMIGKISNLAFLLNILRSKILTIIIIIGIILFLRYKQKLKKRKNRRKELNIRKREIET